jgi:phosphoglycerate dehydrogenase-like enzyme
VGKSGRVQVLISSWLDERHVEQIRAAEPERVEVLYEPDLLPLPRYEADHYAPSRQLDDRAMRHWADTLSRAEVSFDFDWDKPADMLRRAPRLQWVQCTSSGIGPMLVRIGVAGSHLVVTNAAGIHAQPLAEFVAMAALYFAKDMPRLHAWKQQKHWERFCGTQLHGSRMLLIGLGKVGARIAQVCSALGVDVIGHRRAALMEPPNGVQRIVSADGIDAELPHVDYLVIAAPDTPETRNMIDARRLRLLPSWAVVINIGRGPLIDEAALTGMLASGRLRGAALDVFTTEPLPPSSRLWELPNVIVSPHSASTVASENDNLVDLFIENLHRYLDRQPLVNVFDHRHLH